MIKINIINIKNRKKEINLIKNKNNIQMKIQVR